MGSIVYPGGTTFRVWLPFATRVCVSGTFNDWATDTTPLASEGNGYWSADIPDAKAGDRYKYVISGPMIEGIQWRTDPYCKSVANTDGAEGAIVEDTFDWGTTHFQMPDWNELVIYELHVASFNGTSSAPGSFDSIIARLDYLSDLGVNAIEILPIFGFPGAYSLGYNPAFPFDIESNYGTPDGFKGFIRKAHEKGIAVILDIVLNHFGPDDLDASLRRPDGWYINGLDGIYFYSDWRGHTAFGPRPDYGRGEVRSYLRDSAMMWLEEYRVDGLRLDSTINIRNVLGNNDDPAHDLPDGWSLMAWINDDIDRTMPWKITIAEDLQDNAWITRETRLGGAGFDSQWDASFYWKLVTAVTAAADGDRDMNEVSAALTHTLGPDACRRLIYFNNHDQCAAINRSLRLPDRIWAGHADSWTVRKRYTLAAGILCTTPGIPMIFQGDEFLTWGSWDPALDLDWGQLDRYPGIRALFRDLFRLRRNFGNRTAGLKGQHVDVFHVNNTDKLIAYHRWADGGPGDDVVVIANFADRSYDSYDLALPREGTWYVRFNSDAHFYSPDFGNQGGFATTGAVAIGPYSLLILSQ
jgi:1,4-alpha-glucan branching enzyme